MEKKEYAKAIADFTKRLEIDLSNTSALESRGIAYINKKEYAKAIADFTKILEMNSFSPDALIYSNNLPDRIKQRLNHEKIIENTTKTLSSSPNDVDAMLIRGFCYAIAKQFWKAIQDFTTVLKKYPSSSFALMLQIDCYERLTVLYMSDKNKATFSEVKATKLEQTENLNLPHKVVIIVGGKSYNIHGKSLDEEKDFSQAKVNSDNIVVLEDENFSYSPLASLYNIYGKDNKKTIEDMKEIETLLTTSTSHALALMTFCAYRYRSNGFHQNAIPLFDKVLKIDPENIVALLHRGESRMREEEYDKAINDLNKVIHKNEKCLFALAKL